MKHVIIGNGPAGVVAAEALRKLRPQDEVVMIGDEGEPPYSRMAIPYLLMGNIGEAGTHLRKDAGHWQQQNIRLVSGKVAAVDPAGKTVALADGATLAYDKLLVASGSHPVRPPIPGMDLPGVHTCWTLADARAIAARARAGSRVLQIGAGFIGCIILEALAARGVKLTVVEMGDRMVPRMMTAKAGNIIRRWVEQKGVTVHVSTGVAAIEAKGEAMVARLTDGSVVECDLVICAAGVRPNASFLAGTGIEMGQGIRVGANMGTNLPDIFAAGDVTEAMGFHTGQPELNAIQPNAADQARVAAANMTGATSVSQGSLAINVLDTLGLISTSFGQWGGVPGGSGVELADEEGGHYLSLQFKGDVLVGATSIGHTEHVGALRGLVQGRVRLGPWKDILMKNPMAFVEAYLACGQKGALR